MTQSCALLRLVDVLWQANMKSSEPPSGAEEFIPFRDLSAENVATEHAPAVAHMHDEYTDGETLRTCLGGLRNSSPSRIFSS